MNRKLPSLVTDKGEIALPISFEYSNGASRPYVFGAVALGVAAGVVASAMWWRNRVREEILQSTPLERVEDLIASCESKIEDIERSIENLKGSAS